MSQQAIEAGQKALDSLDYTTIENLPTDQDMTRAILEAARPHLEAELRAQIAAEIRGDRDRRGCGDRDYCSGWNHANESAAQIVERVQS